MTPLMILLIAKMMVTVGAVAGPLLVLSKARLDQMAGLGTPDLALYRLYGMALLALVVGYGFGLWAVANGDYPRAVVVVGLVSNGGASAIMLRHGFARTHPASCAFFCLMAAGFLIALLAPGFAMAPLG